MADDKRKAPGTAEGASRRQPPTIDLTAKDITDSVARQAATSSDRASTKAEPPRTERPKPEQPKAEQPSTAVPPSPAPERRPAVMPMLLAGLGGGAVVAAVAAALMLSGALSPPSSGVAGNNNDALTARLDALDKKMSDIAARPQAATGGADGKAVAEIAARLGKLEQAVTKLPAGSEADKLAAIDGQLKALGLAVAGLNRRADEIAASALAARDEAGATTKSIGDIRKAISDAPQPAGRADLDALGKRLDMLEAAANAARQSSAQATSAGAAVRLALAASALREAVNSGGGYAAELDAVKAAGGEAASVAALAPFAAKGLPSDAALAKDLLALVALMTKAAGIDKQATGGFFDKLQANAEKLVRVRPLEETAGADAGAVIARIEARAARNDVSGARTEIENLPAAARQVADGWLKSLAARDTARAAARTLAASAMRGLARQ